MTLRSALAEGGRLDDYQFCMAHAVCAVIRFCPKRTLFAYMTPGQHYRNQAIRWSQASWR